STSGSRWILSDLIAPLGSRARIEHEDITLVLVNEVRVVRKVLIVVAVLVVVTSLANAQPARAPRHWARGTAIRLWIDPEQMPPNGEALVEKAMKTWTSAADG